MVGTKLGNIEPASSPPLPDRAEREQQDSPRLEPGIPNPQQKMTVYSDLPFDGNINPADSSFNPLESTGLMLPSNGKSE